MQNVFTGGIQREKDEVGAYDFKFSGNPFLESSWGEDPATVRRMLAGVLKHLRCIDASFRRSFIATGPLDGCSYNRPTCREFRTSVHGSFTVTLHSPMSRQVSQ